LRASDHQAVAVPSGSERVIFRVVERKWLNHAALLGLPKLRVVGSNPVARSSKSGLGRQRWVVERTFAWLHNRRRLLLRTDRRHETHEAFLSLACCLICWRRLETSFS